MIPTLLLAFSAEAACPVSRTVDELRAALDAVDAAWGADPAEFARSVQAYRDILPCVSSALSARTAAHVHRAEGLDAFLRRDMESARRDFAEARVADPTYVLPESLAPTGNPLRAEWAALPESVERTPFYAPTGVTLVDGATSTERPVDRPFVLQHLVDERPDLTVRVDAGSATPWSPPLAEPASRKSPWPWWVATGAGAVAGGAFYWAAQDTHDNVYLQSETKEAADEQRDAVNALAGVSVGFAALGLGCGAVAAVGTF